MKEAHAAVEGGTPRRDSVGLPGLADVDGEAERPLRVGSRLGTELCNSC